MKKWIFSAALTILAAMPAWAQNISYVLSSVAEPIKKNANVITRYENNVFEVTDLDKATFSVHKVVTVVSDKGKDALSFSVHTSRYASLDDVEIKVFDASGRQVNRYRKKDLQTHASGEGLIDDGYYSYIQVPAPSYPVSVETKFTMKFKGTLFYPAFHILSPGEGVELATYTARVPKEMDLRYREKNISLKPEVTEEGKYKVYKWTVANMAPVQNEPGASYESSFPQVQLAPNRFSYYGLEGDISSWKSFGEWMAGLYKGLDELPENRKSFFRDLVKEAGSEREKVQLIYEYLQKNFRYVSIQLGIGGFKPFSAEFTDNKKYGDCKALSNYTCAALKAVGIRSHVALINSKVDGDPVEPDFPTDRFNHVILCVPQQKDSIWLECTSTTSEFGMLGTSTENRNALLLTEQGGVLVPTPVSKAENNRVYTTTKVKLGEDGHGELNVTFRSFGTFREMMDYYLTEKKDDQKSFLVRSLGFKQPDDFRLEKVEGSELHTTALTMSVEKVPEFVAGNKMFITPRMYKIWDSKLPEAEKRNHDFYFRYPFQQFDTTILQLPDGYTVDALPKVKTLSTAYASYSTKYWFDETQKAIYATAELVLKQHKIPAKSYSEVKKFFDEVLLDDTQRIVIRKN